MNPATDEDKDEGGNNPVHDARAATATEDDNGDDCDEFFYPRDWTDALDLLYTALRTFAAAGDAHEARVTYLRRFKARQTLTGEEQVAKRLIYSARVFDPAEHERSANVVDGLLAALEDKRVKRERSRGARILPYVGNFLLFASSELEALELRQRVADLRDGLGLQRNPTKGPWQPVQYGQHMGVHLTRLPVFLSAPEAKLAKLSRQTKQLLPRPTGEPVHWPIETAYTHCESSGYGWGAVLNGHLEARGFWGPGASGNTSPFCKELNPVQLALEFLLPHPAGRRVLLHEDNHAVCSVRAGATSRSPEMDDGGAAPAGSALNAMLPRYNAAWMDPGCDELGAAADWSRAAIIVAPR
eukprot:jgi/Tetstr1/441098/TSEL_029366.t1